jgi:hypothetical protein
MEDCQKLTQANHTIHVQRLAIRKLMRTVRPYSGA